MRTCATGVPNGEPSAASLTTSAVSCRFANASISEKVTLIVTVNSLSLLKKCNYVIVTVTEKKVTALPDRYQKKVTITVTALQVTVNALLPFPVTK